MRALRQLLKMVPFILVVAIGAPLFGVAYSEIAKVLGLKTITVEVVGTGSMYPSLFWEKAEGGPEDAKVNGVAEYRSSPLMYRRFNGLKVLGKQYLQRPVGYGDMVAFQNAETVKILESEGKNTQVGFIKRVIAVGGDTIELRDGYVQKNGLLLEEPYIYRPRSTYSGTGLAECVRITIPEGQYFVLGDNRKVSTDSRSELGLVKDEDIAYVLPYSDQSLYRPLWRDTSRDSELIGTPTLDRSEFYQLVNEVRTSNSRPVLSANASLSKSAALRGAQLLKNPDTSYNLHTAIDEAGYSNIVLGEFVSYGRFSASELLQNLLAFGDTAKQIMNADYQEIGLTATTKEVDSCPTQVIVGHLGGYIPAKYDQGMVESWQSLRDNLRSIIPSWEEGVGYNTLDQAKLAELLTILRRRLSLAEEIIEVMQKKAWISDAQQARMKQDETDATIADALAKDLNQP